MMRKGMRYQNTGASDSAYALTTASLTCPGREDNNRVERLAVDLAASAGLAERRGQGLGEPAGEDGAEDRDAQGCANLTDVVVRAGGYSDGIGRDSILHDRDNHLHDQAKPRAEHEQLQDSGAWRAAIPVLILVGDGSSAAIASSDPSRRDH